MKQAETLDEKLSPRQSAFLTALLEHPSSVDKAAEIAGVSRTTAWRYLKDPDFTNAHREARRRSVERAISILQLAMTAACTTLVRNLKAGIPSAEIRAAGLILEHGLGGLSLFDHEQRLAALEAASRNGAHP